jgi:hypothetical protein
MFFLFLLVEQNLGEDTRSQSFDTDSITSADSQRSHSLIGLNWLFSSNVDVSANDNSAGEYS